MCRVRALLQKFSVGVVAFVVMSACAYRGGIRDRALPGGYDQVAIPMFKNQTSEVALETYFTNALIRAFERSQVARVTSRDLAPVILEGSVANLEVIRGPGVEGGRGSGIQNLPEKAVLATEFRLLVTVDLVLRRQSDGHVLWKSTYSTEGVYSAPRIGLPIVNSANALYNHSIKHETLAQLASSIMSQAHDLMTESF